MLMGLQFITVLMELRSVVMQTQIVLQQTAMVVHIIQAQLILKNVMLRAIAVLIMQMEVHLIQEATVHRHVIQMVFAKLITQMDHLLITTAMVVTTNVTLMVTVSNRMQMGQALPIYTTAPQLIVTPNKIARPITLMEALSLNSLTALSHHAMQTATVQLQTLMEP